MKPPSVDSKLKDPTWEHDAVWSLLDRAPAPVASAPLTARILETARITPQVRPWWHLSTRPAPLVGLFAAAAAIVISAVSLLSPAPSAAPSLTTFPPGNSQDIEEIQNLADTETLLAAVDHLEDFSDSELAELVGF